MPATPGSLCFNVGSRRRGGSCLTLRTLACWEQVTKEDDNLWPMPDKVGRQELEVVLGDEHISFTTAKIGSLVDVEESKCVPPLEPLGGRARSYSFSGAWACVCACVL